MPSKLQQEIKQGPPFASAKEELLLNLARTAAVLGHVMERKLRPFGISPTQYNVLRILRGAGPVGLCQSEVRARLVAQVPDVPRILSRMERARWIRRARAEGDRRMVMALATDEGLRLLHAIDEKMDGWIAEQLPGFPEGELEQLNAALVKARAGMLDAGEPA